MNPAESTRAINDSQRLPTIEEVASSGMLDGNPDEIYAAPRDLQMIWRRRLQARRAKQNAWDRIQVYCAALAAGKQHRIALMQARIPHNTFFRWTRVYPGIAAAVSAARVAKAENQPWEGLSLAEFEQRAEAHAARVRELCERRAQRVA